MKAKIYRGTKPIRDTTCIELKVDNGKLLFANELMKDAVYFTFHYWSLGNNKQRTIRIPLEKLNVFQNLIPGLYEFGLLDFTDNGISKGTAYISVPGEAILCRTMDISIEGKNKRKISRSLSKKP